MIRKWQRESPRGHQAEAWGHKDMSFKKRNISMKINGRFEERSP
jgi:hypothetical protein